MVKVETVGRLAVSVLAGSGVGAAKPSCRARRISKKLDGIP